MISQRILCLCALFLTGCSATMMQNPQPLDSGEVRVAGGVNLVPVGNLEGRVSVGVGQGVEVTGAVGGFPASEGNAAGRQEGDEVLTGWRVAAGAGASFQINSNVVLKLQAEWMREHQLNRFDLSADDGIAADGGRTIYLSDVASLNVLAATNARKTGAMGYVGLQVNGVWEEITSSCRNVLVDVTQGSCRQGGSGVVEERPTGVMVGGVFGGQYWLSEGEFALQGETILRGAAYAEDESGLGFFSGGTIVQTTVGLVVHFNGS